MDTAKIFSNGGSQAVRLPKNYRFHDNEIFVNKVGDIVLLIPKGNRWKSLRDSLSLFTDDFLSDTTDNLPPEERESIE